MARVDPVVRDSLPGPGPMSRSTVIFVHQGQMAPVMRTACPDQQCCSYIRDEDNDIMRVLLPHTGPDQTVNNVVSTVGPGNETRSVADAPGDVIVRSSDCREIDKGTLDKLRMWQVKPRSELKVYYESSHSIIFDEGVSAFDLCPPGLMYKLDSPWLDPYFFVSLGGWLVTNREQPVIADLRRYCWEPGGGGGGSFDGRFPIGMCPGCVSGFCVPRLDQSFIRSSDPV